MEWRSRSERSARRGPREEPSHAEEHVDGQQLLDEAPVLPASSEAFATFRNLIAHQYGALDGRRVYVLASSDLKDLDTFCGEIARRAGGSA